MTTVESTHWLNLFVSPLRRFPQIEESDEVGFEENDSSVPINDLGYRIYFALYDLHVQYNQQPLLFGSAMQFYRLISASAPTREEFNQVLEQIKALAEQRFFVKKQDGAKITMTVLETVRVYEDSDYLKTKLQIILDKRYAECVKIVTSP